MTGRDAVGEGVRPATPVATPPGWRHRALAKLGLRFDADGVTLRFNARALAWSGAALVACFYVILLFQTLWTYEHHSAFSAIDEQLLYLQSARNFNRYGFGASGFLQDLSTSSDAAGHPFVYNHMPAGPEIMVACITRVLGERYRLLRVVCGIVFLAGVACFLLFAFDLLRQHAIGGAGLTVLFLTPFTVVSLAGHPMYCAFPLLVFFPLVAINRYYRSRRKAWLIAAIAVVLVSSMFLAYQFVLMTAVAWIGLLVLRLVPLERRHVLAFLAATAAGVLAHVVQNAIWLGPARAVDDIRVTLMNRVTGHPTAEQLADFYQSMDVVHHGTHRINVGGLWSSMGRGLQVPGLTALAVMALLLVIFRLWRVVRFDRDSKELWLPWLTSDSSKVPFLLMLRLAAWLFATVCVPLLVFPAYSADYDLQGVGQFFVAIGAVVVLVAAWRWLRALLASSPSGGLSSLAIVLLILEVSLFATATAAAATDYYQKQMKSTRTTFHVMSTRTYATLPKLSELVGGRVVMTNIYPAMVGFFTKETVIGGAEFNSFPVDGPPRPDRAWAKHVRGFGPHVRPTHYVLFRGLFTGFTRYRDAESLARLRAHVAARHRILYEDDLYTVFELEY